MKVTFEFDNNEDGAWLFKTGAEQMALDSQLTGGTRSILLSSLAKASFVNVEGWEPKVIGIFTHEGGGLTLKTKCYGKRTHSELGFQVLVHYSDSFQWINIPKESFTLV